MQFFTEVIDWKIINKDIKMYVQALDDWKYTFRIEKWWKRSTIQNNYYWAVLWILASETWHEAEEHHMFFKDKYLKSHVEVEWLWHITVIRSTTELNTKEFAEYMEKILRDCAELWVIVPDKPEWFEPKHKSVIDNRCRMCEWSWIDDEDWNCTACHWTWKKDASLIDDILHDIE